MKINLITPNLSTRNYQISCDSKLEMSSKKNYFDK